MTVVRNQEKADNEKNIDKEVGKLIEDYIKEKLVEKGITHCCGTYPPPEKVKKKSLTIKVKSENEFKIVAYLLGSLIDSQNQCFRTSFNSWFLDLEQLMLIVQEANSNDELLDRLRDIKCVTMGSYNFYRERRMVRLMNGNKE